MERKICKKTVLILAIALAGICTHTGLQAQSMWVKDYEVARNMVWDAKLSHNIGFLCDSICQGRATGTRGGVEASRWIMRQFAKSRLLKFSDTYCKRFYAGKGLLGRNVIGMLPGSKKTECDSYVIVGAHYDHLGTINGITYPGADSNASGVVALTTLADMFSSMKIMGRSFHSNIIFVAFDGNGMNLSGSKALWKMIEDGELVNPLTGRTITPEKISLMVNIDQIGCSLSPLSSGREDYLIMLGTHSLPPSKRGLLDFCNRQFALDMDLDKTYYGSKNFTDIFYRLSNQRTFIENRIPSVLFTSGITMNTNKTRDTAASLNIPVLKKRIFLMFHWIEKML